MSDNLQESQEPEDVGESIEPPKPPRNQVTIVGQTYHQSLGQDPLVIEERSYFVLNSDEQVWQRKQKATEDPSILNFGWLEEASLIILVNESGKNLLVNPTEAEQAEIDSQILLVGYEGSIPFCEVPPKQSFRWFPYSSQNLQIQSKSGETPFTLYAFPK